MDLDPSDPSSSPSTLEIKNALYTRCAALPADTIFDQKALLDLKVIPNDDLKFLLDCTQKLTQEGLFKLFARDHRACWRVIKREDAEKLKALSADEAIVYSYIETAGRQGIWSRILRSRSNLHMTVMTRCLKTLEGKNYIKQIKTVKFPNRKTYMLAGLQPSEDVTGGPFYTDGVLDDEFVHQMAKWTERYIVGRSWYRPHDSHGKKPLKQQHLSQQQAEKRRSAALEASSGNRSGGSGSSSSQLLLPFPPGYTGYPTVGEITRAINESNISPVTMKEMEMKQLLDILVWDGRIERNQFNESYKAVKKAALAAMFQPRTAEGENEENEEVSMEGESALTEAPCGKCPVLGFCEEGGPVSARTCEYFAEWLEV
ncbi:MAG: hypothetical protein LQ350_004897 [Teloschistes chrysophthalmus]|nr:MAG: hypothetical protein LQ350_004897 [Niorma chrysophthalma]